MAVIEVCVKRHLALPEDGIDPSQLNQVELTAQQRLVRDLFNQLPNIIVELYQ